jgi:4-aminobutyrate aminotransferase-like enzyme
MTHKRNRRNIFLDAIARHEADEVLYQDEEFPVIIKSAKGSLVRDVNGKTYIDLTSFFGVMALGHGNPSVIRAIRKQSRNLIHGMGDVHPPDVKSVFLSKLSGILPQGIKKTILSCNGADAVETALKCAYLLTGKPGVISFRGSYHGLNGGALAVTGIPFFRDRFAPVLRNNVFFAAYPDMLRPEKGVSGESCGDASINEVRKIFQHSKIPVGSVIIEPIQGRGGVIVPPDGFLRQLSEVCRENNAALILDEIFTGMLRTGNWFACQHENVAPDFLCIGKALGGGVPLSACSGTEQAMAAFGKSSGEAIHTSTFLGNPLACSAGMAVIKEMKKQNLIENIGKRSVQLKNYLEFLREKFPFIGDVRGRGMMFGVEIVKDLKTLEPDSALANRIMRLALQKGLIVLTSGVHGNVLSFTPPLSIEENDLHSAMKLVEKCMQAIS